MKVTIQLTHDEIKEAITKWMHEQGIPVVAIESTKIEQQGGSGYGWMRVEELRATVKYECDALGSATEQTNPRATVEQ